MHPVQPFEDFRAMFAFEVLSAAPSEPVADPLSEQPPTTMPVYLGGSATSPPHVLARVPFAAIKSPIPDWAVFHAYVRPQPDSPELQEYQCVGPREGARSELARAADVGACRRRGVEWG